MNQGWREAFAPHAVPAWLTAFDGEPVKALDALLRRRFYLGNLQLAESDELLIDWLELLDGTDFPGRLDAAMAEWIVRRWGDRSAGRSPELLADAWARLLAVVSYAGELEQAGAALGPLFADAHDFLGPLSGSPSRDPLGLYLAAVANHQTDRSRAPHWWWMCDLPDAVPYYHAIYAVAGLRGLPPEPGDPGGGFRRDVARAVVRLARAFYRLGKEGILPKKEAREAFRDVGLLTYAAYPLPARWVEALAAELRRVAEPVGPWLAGLIPGGSPELQRIIRERRSKPAHSLPAAPPRPETWASRARAIAQALPSRDPRNLASAEGLLGEQRHHAELCGDSEPLVKSLCNFASRLVRARWQLDRAAAWADQARVWDPANPYGWTTLGQILKASGRLDAAESVYQETVDRFPNDVVARNGLEGVRHLRVARGEIEPVAESPAVAAPSAEESYQLESLPASEVAEPSGTYDEAETDRPPAGEPLKAPLGEGLEATPPSRESMSRGRRHLAVTRVRLLRRLAAVTAEAPRAEQLRRQAEEILEQVLGSAPGDPRAVTERAHLLIDVERPGEARELLDRHLVEMPSAPDLLIALARAERHHAQAVQSRLTPETEAQALAPGSSLGRLGAGFQPVANLVRGRAYLALQDGQARLDGAARAFDHLQTWVREHLPDDEQAGRPEKLRYLPWLSLRLSHSVLDGLDLETTVRPAELPAIEENLARGRGDVDILEEDFAIRARALLSPVVPLTHGPS